MFGNVANILILPLLYAKSNQVFGAMSVFEIFFKSFMVDALASGSGVR